MRTTSSAVCEDRPAGTLRVLLSLFILFVVSQIIGDELLCRATTAPAVRHLPTKPRNAQLLRCQVDAFLCEHVVDDCQVFLLIRRMVLDDETESIR